MPNRALRSVITSAALPAIEHETVLRMAEQEVLGAAQFVDEAELLLDEPDSGANGITPAPERLLDAVDDDRAGVCLLEPGKGGVAVVLPAPLPPTSA